MAGPADPKLSACLHAGRKQRRKAQNSLNMTVHALTALQICYLHLQKEKFALKQRRKTATCDVWTHLTLSGLTWTT